MMTITTHPHFYAVVGEIATCARQKLSHLVAGIERAVQLVLNGDVALHDDGSATVQSQTRPGDAYTVNGHCDCEDAQHHAPGRWRKHRLAASIMRRVILRLADLYGQTGELIQGMYFGAP
jgi:hypothetical protein